MEKSLFEMRKVVFEKRKILAKIYKKFGSLSLVEYVSQWQVVKHPVDKQVLKIIFQLAEKLYGKELANPMVSQIKTNGLISTIDHHGIWGHPFFLNSNLIFSLYPKLKFLPVFATAGVSLNNSSRPSAVSVFSKKTKKLERFSFFPDSLKMQTVLATKAITKQDFQKVLLHIEASSFLEIQEKIALKSLVTELFQSSKVFKAKNFSDQACLLSKNLWEDIFPKSPKLVYLSLEEIVSEVLQKIILKNSKNFLYKIFFLQTKKLHETFLGMKGCFSDNSGSFLFWGLDQKGHRVGLKVLDGYLVGENFTLMFEAKSISRALKQKQIYPSTLTCFLVMLYSGLNCIGGFNQTSWLTEIKEKFILLLNSIGETKYAKKIANVPTENFAEGILYTKKFKNKVYIPSALNIHLNMILNLYKLAKTTTLAKSIDLQIPEIYKIVS